MDVNPGDRAEDCNGLMEPIGVEGSSPRYDIVHRCVRCGAVRKNKTDTRDDAGALLALARESGMWNH